MDGKGSSDSTKSSAAANASEHTKSTTAKRGMSEPGAGIRDVRVTSVFRAVNFELYAKPNKGVMAFGLIAITGCVAYIAYMNATKENNADEKLYEQFQSDGSTEWARTRRSKWD